MGPFGLLSGMQCSHGIISMGHRSEGTLNLNGKALDFSDGLGYIVEWSLNGAIIRQGRYRLAIELLEEQRQSLRAPVEGSMKRTIHKSLCAAVSYCFWEGKEILFQHIDRYASYEYSNLNKVQAAICFSVELYP